MTKKQYFIPRVETMPLFNANALCVGSPDPEPVDNNLNVNINTPTTDVW